MRRTLLTCHECFIGASLDSPEARAFLAAHADAERLERPLGANAVHILMSRSHL